jgi:multidrug efflux system membrane fusion protein
MPERQGSLGFIKSRWFWWFLGAGLVLLVAWGVVSRLNAVQPKGPPAGMVSMIAVKVEAAKTEDLALELRGLGTVTAFNTVTVRSRVQGELVEVLFSEGQVVKEGDLLAQIDPRPYQVALDQARGVYQQDLSQLNNAKLDLKRYQTLRKQDSIAPQLLDTQAALVQKYEGLLQSDQANVDSAALQLNFTQIKAPISGRLGLRKVDVGNLLVANDPQGLVVITQTKPIAVVFTLAESDLPAVRRAMADGDQVAVVAYDRADLKPLAQGELITVDNQIDVSTGTFKLKAKFANDNDALFPNQFVNARILVQTLKEVLTIPTSTIQLGNQGAFVYVIAADDTAQVRQISVGDRTSDRSVVLDGLKAGDRVVTEGTDRLRSGSKVKVIGK